MAVRELAARWLMPREAAPLEAWLQCATAHQPATLGLSIGMDVDAASVRLQVYAHPEANASAVRFARAAVEAAGGNLEAGSEDHPPVLVGIAVSSGGAPLAKLYYRRTWKLRRDTDLVAEGLGDMEPFNPGWGLAVRQYAGGRAQWVKWDFPVTTHYQDSERFVDAFWRSAGAGSEPVPDWLSGASFSPWLTWASVGRRGRALYFCAR
jgi:hypothetical protein